MIFRKSRKVHLRCAFDALLLKFCRCCCRQNDTKKNDQLSKNEEASQIHHCQLRHAKAGIKGASSHSARRTFITNLANQGVGVRVIMGLSGHKALSSVQCYIDCNDDMKRKAVELV